MWRFKVFFDDRVGGSKTWMAFNTEKQAIDYWQKRQIVSKDQLPTIEYLHKPTGMAYKVREWKDLKKANNLVRRVNDQIYGINGRR